MNIGNRVFSLTPTEKSRLFEDVGRRDIAAERFVEDVEACLQAFDFAAGQRLIGGLPQAAATNLEAVVDAAARLRSALYELPREIALLIDLHLLSEGARRRLLADLALIVEPLEDIAGAIVDVRHDAVANAGTGDGNLEQRLVRALAAVYRNRLNRKPTADDDSGFPATLSHILEFAGHQLPRLAAARAALTPVRLRAILNPSSRPGSAILDGTVPQHHAHPN